MSVYRNLLIGFAAAAIAMPILADNTATSQGSSATNAAQSQQTANTIELSDSGVKTTETSATTDENKSTTTTGDTAKQDMASTSDSKVDLNKATVKDLMKVKGLNATKAKAIVAYRKKHGDFKSVEALKEVKGFKKMKDDEMKKIVDQLSV